MEPNDENLLLFKNEILHYAESIYQYSNKFRYFGYFGHNHSILSFFDRCKPVDNNFITPVDRDEFFTLERLYNGGLLTLNDQYKNIEFEAYGYDFERYYTNLLKSITIPIQPGVRMVLTELSFNLPKCDVFRVKIHCTNAVFWNLFNQSAEHHYFGSMLNDLYEYKDLFGITFELLPIDSKYNYNCYHYTEFLPNCIFEQWFKQLHQLQQQLPGNKLVKLLQQKLWGILSEFKKEKVLEQELSNYHVCFRDKLDESADRIYYDRCRYTAKYILIDPDEPYKHNMGRLKTFLSNFGRRVIFHTVMKQQIYNHVVRIHTDGIILNKSHEFKGLSYAPLPDKKTTGTMIFKNRLFGFHVCLKCKNRFRYVEFANHIC